MKPLMPPIETSSDNRFRDGNTLTGELGTIASAVFFNNVQDSVRSAQSEILTVLEESGIEPDEGSVNQLLAAIKSIITSGSLAVKGGKAGQFLKKTDNPDFSAEWTDLNAGTIPYEKQTVTEKLSEFVSILDVGGKDDYSQNNADVTNNHAPFISAIEKRPCKVHFPRTKSGTGIYYFNGTAGVDLTDVEIVADPGVSFYTPTDNINNIVRKKGVRANRYVPINVGGDSAFEHGIGSQMRLKPAEKFTVDSTITGESHVPEALTFTSHSATTFELNGLWPNAAFKATTDGFTIAASSVKWNSVASSFRGVVFPAVVGDTLLASCRDGGTYSCAFVETVSGWCQVRYVSNSGMLVVSEFNGQATTDVNYSWPDGKLPPYNLDKAVMGVCVIGANSFGVVVNGVIVLRVDTLTAIVSAGWSNGFDNTTECTLSDPIRLRGKVQHGLPLIKVVCLGDSTGDSDVSMQSQFEYASQFYAGIGGGQVASITNLSVRGHTITQQRDLLLATNISGFTFCLVQIGINDIQAQTALATFNTALNDIVAYCKTNRVTPILGIPAMFYSRADIATMGVETAHIGQNSGNSHRGTLYRLAVMKAAAANNVPINTMSAESLGVVTPRLLAIASADKTVIDNIHPTAFASMTMGLSWARAMAAWFVSDGRESQRKKALDGYSSFRKSAARVPARYFTAGGGGSIPQTPFYTVSDDGKQVTLSYYLSRGDADWAGDVVVGTLPERLRPLVVQRFLSQGRLSTVLPVGDVVNIEITLDGNVRFIGATNDAVFMPISVTYAI
ncbi:SGNH/GDSL hydrolase family protein [Pectobacterium actinidiae]|uniref:SGNH/GDSL hydrolase family protein n=1 Tax=Pectobacterium actinidiae TaxID=1507808 RepID=A0ABW8G7N6_9GAMM